MSELSTTEQNINPMENDGVMTNIQWETFAKGDLINFLIGHNLQKVTVDDGAGKKATVKIKSNGEYAVSYTSSEVM
jgi:hypothetical protein